MNRLPKVLQNEILDYLIGDRPYWKQQFNKVLAIIKGYRFIRISKSWGGRTIRLFKQKMGGFPQELFVVGEFLNDTTWIRPSSFFEGFGNASNFFEHRVDGIRVLAEPRMTRSKSTRTFHRANRWRIVGTPRKLPSFFSES